MNQDEKIENSSGSINASMISTGTMQTCIFSTAFCSHSDEMPAWGKFSICEQCDTYKEWSHKMDKRNREKRLTRLDRAIYDVSYILDVLNAYRDIQNTGNCNWCSDKLICQYVPKPGETVRYNCPFFKEEEEWT